MYASSFNKGTLASRYEFLHFWCKPESKDLANNFRKGVDEADRPEIRDGLNLLFFFGMRTIFALFSRLRFAHRPMWK